MMNGEEIEGNWVGFRLVFRRKPNHQKWDIETVIYYQDATLVRLIIGY